MARPGRQELDDVQLGGPRTGSSSEVRILAFRLEENPGDPQPERAEALPGVHREHRLAEPMPASVGVSVAVTPEQVAWTKTTVSPCIVSSRPAAALKRRAHSDMP